MSSKITSMRWTIAIITLLVLACVGVLVYAICTKQLQYVEKTKDVVEDVVTNPEGTTTAAITFSRLAMIA